MLVEIAQKIGMNNRCSLQVQDCDSYIFFSGLDA